MRVTDEQIGRLMPVFERSARANLQELTRAGMQPEDFVQEMTYKLLKSGEEIDEDRTSLKTYGNLICRRYLDDLCRNRFRVKRTTVDGTPIQHLTAVPETEGHIYETLPNKDVQAHTLQRMTERLPDQPIGQFHGCSWRQLFLLSVDHDEYDLSLMLGLHPKRVEELQGRLCRMVLQDSEV